VAFFAKKSLLWVSDDTGWNGDTVAALAKLIDDLRRLAPDAQVDLEWDDEGGFVTSIDRFLVGRSGWRLTNRLIGQRNG
jgi:hypothetical protein